MRRSSGRPAVEVVALAGPADLRESLVRGLLERGAALLDTSVALESIASAVLPAVPVRGRAARLFPDAPLSREGRGRSRVSVRWPSMTEVLLVLKSSGARAEEGVAAALDRLEATLSSSPGTETVLLDRALAEQGGGALLTVVESVSTLAEVASVHRAGGVVVLLGPPPEASARRRRGLALTAEDVDLALADPSAEHLLEVLARE